MNATPPSKGSIILVHGILTHADWYRDVRDALQAQGYRVHLTNYGRVDLIRFLLPTPFFRNQVKEKIFRQIRAAIQSDPKAKYSIVAHSFGSYIVSRILQDEFDLRINRIIFAGSVVRYDFPFEQFSERFSGDILNEVQAKDPWPAFAESITTGYGSAGTFGFKRPRVHDRWNDVNTPKDPPHSAVLNSDHAINYWLPFLERGEVLPKTAATKAPFWIRLLNLLRIKYWILLAAIALALTFLGVAVYAAEDIDVQMHPGSVGWQLSDNELASKVNASMDQKCPLDWLDSQCDGWVGRYVTKRSWRGVNQYDHKLNKVLFPEKFIGKFRDPEKFWYALRELHPNCISISEIQSDLDIYLNEACNLARAP
jgi:pimeloyl-ACP methyl ester carboxylesterase